jgi:Spy/CpxP family protein refolding chaperone
MLKRFKLVALAAVAVVSMAGCGAVMHQAAAEASDPLGFRALQTGEAPGPFGGPFHGRMARQLGLTDAQQAQIKAILEQHKPPQADGQAHLAELKALVLADTVDPAALKALADQRKAEFQSHQAERLAVAGELRAVLTDDQRTKLLALLAKDPPPFKAHLDAFRARIHERLAADLGLSADQQAALTALDEQAKAMPDPARGKAMREAVAAFVQSGDQAALGTAMRAQLDGKSPVDQLIAFAASLDKAQRTKLVEKAETLARFHHGGRPPFGP